MTKPINSLRLNPDLILSDRKISKKTKRLNITGVIKHNSFISIHEVSLSIRLLDSQSNELDVIKIAVTENNSHLKFNVKLRNMQHIKRAREQAAQYAEVLIQDS